MRVVRPARPTPSLWGTLPADASLAAPMCRREPCVWWQLKWRNPGALLRRTEAGAQRQASRRQATSGAAREGGPRRGADPARRRSTRVRRVAGCGVSLAVWAQSRYAVRDIRRKRGFRFPEVGRVAKQLARQSKKEKHNLQPEPLAVRQLGAAGRKPPARRAAADRLGSARGGGGDGSGPSPTVEARSQASVAVVAVNAETQAVTASQYVETRPGSERARAAIVEATGPIRSSKSCPRESEQQCSAATTTPPLGHRSVFQVGGPITVKRARRHL